MTLSRSTIAFTVAVVLIVVVAVILWTRLDASQEFPKNLAEIPEDYDVSPTILGSRDAEVMIIEFASFSCPGCGYFHTQIIKELREEYIETGKVAIAYFDFPLDSTAYAMSVFSRCGEGELRPSLIRILYNAQQSLLRAPNPMQALMSSGKLLGIDGETYQACIADEGIAKAIADERKLGIDVFNVGGTPSLFLNGMKIEENSFESVKQAIDAVLHAN